MIIDVREAVINAQQFLVNFQDLFGNIDDLRLEEIEKSEDDKFWLITISFSHPILVDLNKPNEFTSPISELVRSKVTREYKLLKIDGETGEVRSVKIREI